MWDSVSKWYVQLVAKALNDVPQSKRISVGVTPRLAIIIRRVSMHECRSKNGAISRCIARVVRHVNNNTHRFSRRRSTLTSNGPK